MTPAAKKQIRELLDSIAHCINSVPNDALRDPTEAEILSYLIDQECNMATAAFKGDGMILGLTIKNILALRRICYEAQLRPEDASNWGKDWCLVKKETVQGVNQATKRLLGIVD